MKGQKGRPSQKQAQVGMEKSIDRKKVKMFDRILTVDIVLTALLLIALLEQWPDRVFIVVGFIHTAFTIVWVIKCITVLHLDRLEAIKPVCVMWLLFIAVSPIPLILPPFWPSDLHSEIWVRGTRGLASLIVIALCVIYLVKTIGKKERRKLEIVECLVWGGIFCLACGTTMV